MTDHSFKEAHLKLPLIAVLTVPFIKNVTFNFVQLLPKKSTWFEIETALFTSPREKTKE